MFHNNRIQDTFLSKRISTRSIDKSFHLLNCFHDASKISIEEISLQILYFIGKILRRLSAVQKYPNFHYSFTKSITFWVKTIFSSSSIRNELPLASIKICWYWKHICQKSNKFSSGIWAESLLIQLLARCQINLKSNINVVTKSFNSLSKNEPYLSFLNSQ